MSSFLGVIHLAFGLFPLLAALLTLPYLVAEYRRVGTVSPWRSVVVYSLALYLLCVVFLVLLPLPADRTADYGIRPQLHLFDWVAQARASGVTVDWERPRTIFAALKNPNVYGAAFNVAMLVPWGFYLRYLFKRRWWQALFLGFCLSLSFELTQLTGDWGLYAHPYRHFDVDDLFNNTTGTMLGFWLTCLVAPLLPDLDAADQRSLARNLRYPPLLRRVAATAVDLLLTAAVLLLALAWLERELGLGASVAWDDAAFAGALLCATGVVGVLVPLLGFATPGEALCKLRIRDASGRRATRAQVLARQALLWWGALWLVPMLALLAPEGLYVGHAAAVRSMVLMVAGLWGLSVLVRALACAGGRRAYVGLPDLFSRTRVMSLAQVHQWEGQFQREDRFQGESKFRRF